MKKIIVYGSMNTDIVVQSPHLPRAGETVYGTDFFLNCGGKGANQAVAAARGGASVCMVGAVGSDVFGEDIRRELKDFGIDTSGVCTVSGSTGAAVITLVDNDNRIILNRGANHKVQDSAIEEALMQADEGDILITQFELPIDRVAHALEKAKQRGLITIVNPAPATHIPSSMIENIDYLIPNESELEIISGLTVTNKEQAMMAAESLAERGFKHIIVTLGADGCIYRGASAHHFPAFEAEPADTTAAGDTFIGYFASAQAQCASIESAIIRASAAAAIAITRKGAMKSIPSVQEVESFLNAKGI